jgi:GNAT superfamily N-acetyltransferase
MLDSNSVAGFKQFIPADVLDLVVQRPETYIMLGAASKDDVPCGVIIVAPGVGGADLVHLYVAPEWRMKGVGSKLFDELLMGLPSSMPEAKLHCLFAPDDERRERDPFVRDLLRRGFDITESEGGVYRTTLSALAQIDFWRQETAADPEIVPLSKLPAGAANDFGKRVTRTLELAERPYAERGLLPDISHALLIDGRVEAIVAVTEDAGALILSWLYFENVHIKHMPGLLRAAFGAATRVKSPDTELRFSAIGSASTQLGAKLCPPDSFRPFLMAEANIRTLKTDVLARIKLEELLSEDESNLSWWDNLWVG